MYLNRARVVTCLCFLLIVVILPLTAEILEGFGQDRETALLAEYYTTTLIPGVFFLL